MHKASTLHRPRHTASHISTSHCSRRWRKADDLTDLPELNDPRKTILQRLLTTAVPAAYFVNTKLAALILLKSARISLRDGYTDMSAFGIAGSMRIMPSRNDERAG